MTTAFSALAGPGPLWAQTRTAAQTRHDPRETELRELEEDRGLYSCGKARGRVSVSFKPDVELKDLITWAMGFTCKNFVYGSGISRRSDKVTIIAPKKMSAGQAWRLFLVALQTMNLTVVPKGNVLEIIEAAKSKKSPLPVYGGHGDPAGTDQLVRLLLRPEHLDVEDLRPVVETLTSVHGSVTTLPKSGMLLITDYGSHITKIRSLLDEIDRPLAGERIYMIRVRHADVTELTAKLNEILGSRNVPGPAPVSRKTAAQRRRTARGARQTRAVSPERSDEIEAATPSKIIADERTSSIIVLATEAAYLRVRALVKRLDVAIEGAGGGRINVYYLENADAEDLATTLASVITGISQPSAARGQPRRPAVPVPGDGADGIAFEGQVRVTHDKPTNALVVIASVKDFHALKQVIRQLDVPRRQVFIEAVILEVNVSNTRDLGVSFHGGTQLDNGTLVLGGLQHGLRSLSVESLAAQSGLLGGAIGPLLANSDQLLGKSIPSYGLLFQALATSSNANVLSSPHLLTTDNEAAEISAGKNIPYQSTLTTGLPGGGQQPGFAFPLPSIQRQDVALTLKITPHINATDNVRLEIEQEISDIADMNFGGNGPSWSKRTIKTTVVVKDRQSIVIGGLMSDRYTQTETKIPLLGDLPILGYLFKYTKMTKDKTNLLILLTPHVINHQLDIEDIVQRKVRERKEFVRQFSTIGQTKYQAEMDYRRKRGLIEEINQQLQVIDRDRETLRELDRHLDEYPDGEIQYEEEAGEESQDAVEVSPPAEAGGDTPEADQPDAEPQSDGEQPPDSEEEPLPPEVPPPASEPDAPSGEAPGETTSMRKARRRR